MELIYNATELERNYYNISEPDLTSYNDTTIKSPFNTSLSSSSLETNQIIWTLIDGGLMLAILSGNILTICAVKLSRKLARSVANQFILNLAFSDLFVGLTLPYHLIFYLSDVLGHKKIACLLRFALLAQACSASIFNLISIAIDRYVAIVYPLHYNRYMTRRTASLVISVCWVLGFIIGTMPLYWNRWDGTGEQKCEIHIVLPKNFMTLVAAPAFAAVWAVMFALYVRIWREASDHVKRLRTTSYYQTGFQTKKDWKSIQVVLLVLGCFSICWLPYLIVACYQATERPDEVTERLKTIYKCTFSLAMANSCMNPLIYAWKNTRFRQAFIRLLHCQTPDSSEYNPSCRNNYMQNSSIRSGGDKPNGRIATITPQNSFKTGDNHLRPYDISYRINNNFQCTESPNELGVRSHGNLKHIESTITIISNDVNVEREDTHF